VVIRGDKLRASTWRVLEELDCTEGIRELSSVFGPHAEAMVAEQLAWREALARPVIDKAAIEDGLKEALAVRGLNWRVQQFASPLDAWLATSDRDTSATSAPWVAWSAWVVFDAWSAWEDWASMDTWDTWLAWSAREDLSAEDTRDALCYHYAALMGWVSGNPGLLTVGIRDAYHAGLGMVIPTGQDTLAWTLDEML